MKFILTRQNFDRYTDGYKPNLIHLSWLALILLFISPLSLGQDATSRPIEVVIELRDPIDPNQKNALISQLHKDLSIAQLKHDEFPAQTDFSFARAETEISQSLRAQGFYQPQISSHLNRTTSKTQVVFQIEVGQPVLIRQLDLQIQGEGRDLLIWNQYRQFDLALRRGNPLNHGQYNATLNDLRNIALNQGYLDAHFTRREFLVYPHALATDIHIHLNTGEAYQFGEVRFSGSNQIDTPFLNKFVEIEPGDRYTQQAISELQRSLIDTNYFGLVRITPQFAEEAEGQIPLEVEVEDNLRRRYSLGAGFGTDTGARLLLGFEDRLVNKQGHNYQIESLIGERAQSFNINYRIPGGRPAKQHWAISAGWDATQSGILKRERTAFTPNYHFQFAPLWRLNLFVSLESETFRYQKQLNEQSQLLLTGAGLQKRWVNNDAYPSSGYRHNGVIRLSSENLLSESEFLQLDFSSRGVFSPLHFWRVHGRAHLALTFADEDQVIPSSYRFLLGGESLRGYGFESIGIEKTSGVTVGGRNMFLSSLESDVRLSKYFGLGVFGDAGQVFNNELPEELKVGAGMGLRGFTPVGIAKLDIAWPVSEDIQPWRIHFSIGLDL